MSARATPSDQPSSQVSDRRPRSARGQRRRWGFRLAAIVLALLPFVLLELTLRWLGIGHDTRLVVGAATPAAPRAFRFNPATDRAYYGVEDLWGPDPRPFELPKPAGTYRIVVVGGSSVAGFPYPFELALPKQLEVVLQRQLPERRFEVLNAGMIAITSISEIDIARQALDCQPDLIVVHSGHNEFYGPGGSASNFGSLTPTLYPVLQFFKRQRAFQLLFALVQEPAKAQKAQLIEALPADVAIPLSGPIFESTRQRYQSNLTRLVELVKQSKTPVLVSTAPSNLRDLAPLQPTRDAAAAKYLLEADKRISYREYDQALATLAEGRLAAPADPLLVYRQAQCLESLGRAAEAAEAYSLAADLDGCRFRAARPFLEVVRQVAAAEQIHFCDVDQQLKARSRFAAPGSDFFLEHVHYNVEGTWQAASILGRCIVEDVLHEPWRPERHPDHTTRDALLGLTPLDYLAADSLTMIVFDAWPFNLSSGRDREMELLKARLAANYSQLDPLERELFGNLGMTALEQHLWHAMGAAWLRAGHTDRALAAFQRHIERRPWDPLGYEGAAATLKAQGKQAEADALLQRASQVTAGQRLVSRGIHGS